MTTEPSTSARRHEEIEALREEDSAWLAERLVEYKELLDFLHAN
jgi:hypothetical protein